MIKIMKDSLHGAATTLSGALIDSADDLEGSIPKNQRHDRRMTLAIVAGGCFLLGFLWAKAMAARG